jgi:hypothetical protein
MSSFLPENQSPDGFQVKAVEEKAQYSTLNFQRLV